MRLFRPILAAAAVAFMFQGWVDRAMAADPIGVLRCNVSGGVGFIITSDKALACTFEPQNGAPEHYLGTITRFGLDIGVTGPGRLVWAVLGTDSRSSRYPLEGNYAGATAELSLGPGVGANALVGGNNRSIVLQPLSVSATTGVDLAAGVGALTLIPAP
jgi:Protein of unknown function (DUF992)